VTDGEDVGYCWRWLRLLAAMVFVLSSSGPVQAQSAHSDRTTYAVTGVAGNDVLNIRDRADGKTVVGHIPPNGRGVVMLGPRAKVSGANWAQVQYADVSGWVNARFLAAEPPRPRDAGQSSMSVATAAIDLQTPKPFAGRRVALVIGNGDYAAYSGLPRLEPARNDGQDMTAALSELGFDVVSRIDADLQQSREALQDFASRANGADVAVVYFSGYGLQVGGENYLLPVSASVRDMDAVAQQALPLFALTETVREAKPGLGVVILDASREIGELENQPRNADAAFHRGLARVKSPAGLLVALAAEPDSVAREGGGRNSTLTAALLKELRVPGVEVRDTFQNVREAVLGETRGAQSPWIDEALEGKRSLLPTSAMNADRFYGDWSRDPLALQIDANRVSIIGDAGAQQAREVAANSQQCGGLYERNIAAVAVDDIPRVFTDQRFAQWARSATHQKSIMVMVVTCGQESHRFFFLLTEQQRMLMAEWRERDWVMYEELARGAQRVGTR